MSFSLAPSRTEFWRRFKGRSGATYEYCTALSVATVRSKTTRIAVAGAGDRSPGCAREVGDAEEKEDAPLESASSSSSSLSMSFEMVTRAATLTARKSERI